MSIAFVFPGMSPLTYADLGRYLSVDAEARRLRAVADDVLGYRVLGRLLAEQDPYGEPAVVAFLLLCTALARRAEDRYGTPVAVAGPSFGQRAAAAYTGALSIEDSVRLAVDLTRAETAYFAAEHTDVVTQSIARLPADRLAELSAALTGRGAWHEISCRVDDDLAMVTLREADLDGFLREVRAAGGFPLYTMRPPVHCTAFTGLRDMAVDALAGVTVRDPRVPIVSDQTGTEITTADGVRALILDYFTRPVHWPTAVAGLAERGVTRLAVCGPDSLFSRVRSVTRAFEVIPINPRTVLRPERDRTPQKGSRHAVGQPV